MVKTQSLVLSYLMANNYSPKPKTINKQTRNAETNMFVCFRMLFNIFKGWSGEGQVEERKGHHSFWACGI